MDNFGKYSSLKEIIEDFNKMKPESSTPDSAIHIGSADDVKAALKFRSEFGADATIGSICEKLIGHRFRCPKCNGTGYIMERYNAYPTGLPDSGWVQNWKYRKIECDLCQGMGWTAKEYREKTKIVNDGYEEVE